jgi:hypothetical protein
MLAHIIGIAASPEHFRKSNRMIRKIAENTNKYILDWLKYFQSKCESVRIDLVNWYIELKIVASHYCKAESN